LNYYQWINILFFLLFLTSSSLCLTCRTLFAGDVWYAESISTLHSIDTLESGLRATFKPGSRPGAANITQYVNWQEDFFFLSCVLIWFVGLSLYQTTNCIFNKYPDILAHQHYLSSVRVLETCTGVCICFAIFVIIVNYFLFVVVFPTYFPNVECLIVVNSERNIVRCIDRFFERMFRVTHSISLTCRNVFFSLEVEIYSFIFCRSVIFEGGMFLKWSFQLICTCFSFSRASHWSTSWVLMAVDSFGSTSAHTCLQ
jgi:hypothetical protein